MKQYFWNLLILLDCAIDSVLFGSSPFETMSSRCYRHRDCWQGRYAMRLIDWSVLRLFGQSKHCYKSAQPEAFYVGYEILK
jgi:hypothetical protein